MTDSIRCPQCGIEVPGDAPQGLCPNCVLKAGFGTPLTGSGAGSQGDAASEGSASARFIPPTPEELAPYFPDLEILELIGRGGMGVVYKARQKRLDRLVALKILAPKIGQDAAFAARFEREARALAMLGHPHIVAVYDFGQTEGVGEPEIANPQSPIPDPKSQIPDPKFSPLYYFLMEFIDGLSLRQLLDTGKLAPEEALAIVPQICEALQYAHDMGVVHRDIKPENILIDKRGRIKIADFGIAKLVGREAKDRTLTGEGQVIGTPQYMAPEQIEHPLQVDHRADIYSLGVVFYQMLTGELPIGRFAPPSKKVQIDVRLDEVVLRALEKEPELRYQHASDIKTQVENIVTTPLDGEIARLATPREPASDRNSTATQPRIPMTAIAGLVWAAIAVPATIVSTILLDVRYYAVGAVLLFMGLSALLGTTALGCVALSQIRRSAGRLFGLRLALFDALLFPLLIIDGVMISIPARHARTVATREEMQQWDAAIQEHLKQQAAARPQIMKPGEAAQTIPEVAMKLPEPITVPISTSSWALILATVLLAVGVDYLIIRWTWRAAKRPVGSPSANRTMASKVEPSPAVDSVTPAVAPVRMSKTALAGAVWGGPLVVVLVLALCVITLWLRLSVDILFPVLSPILILLLATSIGVPVLGIVALRQIRHSAGRLYGLALALFDLLAFPLLVVDAAIVGFGIFQVKTNLAGRDLAVAAAVLIVVACIVIDFLAVRWAWRAANRPPTGQPKLAVPKTRLSVAAAAFFFLFGVAGFAFLVSSLKEHFENARARIQWRVFEADAKLVDQLVPRPTRELGGSAAIFPQTAEVSDDVFEKLLADGVKDPGMLDERMLEGTWWPKLASNWHYSRHGKIHGAGYADGFLGLRRQNGILQLRAEYDVSHGMNSYFAYWRIDWEGRSPSPDVSRAFFLPLTRQDGTARYLIIALDVTLPEAFDGQMPKPTSPAPGPEAKRTSPAQKSPASSLQFGPSAQGATQPPKEAVSGVSGGTGSKMELPAVVVDIAANQGGPWLAKLPKGSVELVGITRFPPTAQSQWWKPDGAAASIGPFQQRPVKWSLKADNYPLAFLFRTADMPADTPWPVWEVEPSAGNSGASGVLDLQGNSLRDYDLYCAEVGTPTGTAKLRVAIDTGAWETAVTQKADSHGTATYRRAGRQWTVTLLRAEVAYLFSGDSTQVLMSSNEPYHEWRTRLVAVARDGSEHESSITGARGYGRAVFVGVPVSTIKEFCFQVRPFQWAEFRNVALRPNDNKQAPDEATLPPSTRKIVTALHSPTQMEFEETPLTDVVDFLKDLHKIPIQFDRKVLTDAAVRADVSCHIKGVTLQNALHYVLGQLGLVHVINDEVLLITTEQEGKRLVKQGALDPSVYRSPKAAGAAATIVKALRSDTQANFAETPLEDVVAYFRDFHKIEILIDKRSLAAANIKPSVPVTIDLKDVSLAAGLRLLLRNIGLTYVVEDEYILITVSGKEQAESARPVLIYEVDPTAGKSAVDMDRLIASVDRRLNSGPEKLARVKKLDNGRIEVALLRASETDRQRVYRLLERQGTLEFRILADNRHDAEIIKQAQKDPSKTEVLDASGKRLAWWVAEGPGQKESFAHDEHITRRTSTRDSHKVTDVLVVTDSCNVTGAYLTKADAGMDSNGWPCIEFTLDEAGGKLFAKLTGGHLPDNSGMRYRLGIILDGEIQSAPSVISTISQRGQITGNFTKEEVLNLAATLNAGSLPVRLRLLQPATTPSPANKL